MTTKTQPHRRRKGALAVLVAAGLAFSLTSPANAAVATGPAAAKPTIVLLHGAFADASGWTGVIDRLKSKGFPTVAPANPLRGLPSDTAYIKSVIDQIPGPLILVGHSYGGAVITNAALGDPDVKGLVYVAAFAPDEGDSVGGLSAKFPGSMLTPENLDIRVYPTTDEDSLGLEGTIEPAVFRQVFAGDLPARVTSAMSATQRPAELASLEQPSGVPAWKTIPSWFVVATMDNAIPAATQRFMAERAGSEHTIELKTSHVAMISQPVPVSKLIEEAAAGPR